MWFEALAHPPSRTIDLFEDGDGGINGAVFLAVDDDHAIIIGDTADGQNSEGWGMTFPLDGTSADIHYLEDIRLFGNAALLHGGKAVATFTQSAGISVRTVAGALIDALPDEVEGQCLAGFGDVLLAGGGGDGALWIWALDTRQLLATVQTSPWKQQIVGIAWHPSGDWLVTTSQGDGVRLWSVAKLQATPHGAMVTPVSAYATDDNRMYYEPAFSSDGALVAVGCGNGDVLVFDFAPDQLRPRHRLSSGEDEVMTAAFHPTGRQLVTGSRGRISVWDTITGALVTTREPADPDPRHEDEDFPPTQIAGIRFARGGALLVVARSSTVELWDLGSDSTPGR